MDFSLAVPLYFLERQLFVTFLEQSSNHNDALIPFPRRLERSSSTTLTAIVCIKKIEAGSQNHDSTTENALPCSANNPTT
jgi:hypothetical protein